MFFKKNKPELPPIARFKLSSPEGEPPEDPPNQYGNKSSKDVPPAKTQRIAPPCPQPPPTRIVKDGGTRIFNCEPPKGSKPKPPRRQYDTNFIPPTNTPPPDAPPNQYGNVGSIDNSKIDILLPNIPTYEEWKKQSEHFKNIKGVNNMRNHYDGKLDEYPTQENNQEPYFNREDGKFYAKPPIGIMPHKIWLELRIQELSKALTRYATKIGEDKKCMIEWSEELTMLLNEYFKEE